MSAGVASARNFLERTARVEAENFGEFDEFDHVNAPLAALQTGDKGLIFAKPLREFGLGHTSFLALPNEERDQRLVAIRIKRLPHKAPGEKRGFR